jgi:flagellar protein FlhE
LPILHSKGFAYTSQLPIAKAAKMGQKIMRVSWNWNVQGWPRGLEVSLCQGPARCIDVSRQRSGSTDVFNNLSVDQPFNFVLKLSPASPAPIAGQLGKITVNW